MSTSATEVTVGIITALPVESAAVRLLVDGLAPLQVLGDRNHYQVGRLPSAELDRPHEVAVTVLPEDGTRNAAAICADVLRSFPAVRCVVVTGIAGGVPAPHEVDRHVRLGDVVVATGGVIDYDHVRTVDGVDHLRRAVDGLSRDLLRADRELEVKERLGIRPWEHWLVDGERAVPQGFVRPPDDTDVLIVDGKPVRHPSDAQVGRSTGQPRIHRGAIGSADRLLRDAMKRDELARRHRIRAVEMEASGIAVGAALRGTHWFAVRGIADYCDNKTKNDLWHPYASLAAAAYVRALLAECLPFAAVGAPTPVARGSSGDLPGDHLVKIVDALLDIDMFRDDDDRQSLLALLPRDIRTSIPSNRRGRLHAISVVRACAGFPHGKEALVRMLRVALPDGSVQRERAEAAINAYWPLSPS